MNGGSESEGFPPETTPLVLPADEFAAVKALVDALCGPDGKPVRYLTGVSHGWHAVSLPSMDYLRTGPADSVAFAECGELVRVAPKFGAYNRADVPVSNDPCFTCSFTVAAAAGTLQAEIDRLRPTSDELPALDRLLPDPFLAVNVCRAILTEPDWELGHPASIQLLAKVAAHRPVLLLPEDCAEGDCQHIATDEECHHYGGGCHYPDAAVGCKACSLQTGSWAGEWEGQFREECTIPAPCAVLLALAKYAGVAERPQGYASRTEALSAPDDMDPLFPLPVEGTS